jgi:ketosteroid isomerase-like protein
VCSYGHRSPAGLAQALDPLDAGDRVVISVVERARGKRSEVPVEREHGHVWTVDEGEEAGDRVVSVVRQRAVAKVSRIPAEQISGQIWTVQDGLITYCEFYNGAPDEALKAVGLEE